jgi:KaiC/GvpD/RAD55 family RecA-like ATPase
MFDSENRAKDQAITPPQNSNNVEGAIVGIHDENNIPLETNAEVQKNCPELQQPDKNEIGLEVSSGELKLPPKEPDRIATEFDMFKDDYTLDELLDLKVTEIPFLIEKLIPRETLVVLAGQSEIGKSTFYSQLALAIVRGDNEFLGLKLNAIYGKVLIVSTEDGLIPTSFRANRQVINSTIEVENRKNLRVIFNFDKLEEKIMKHLKHTKVDLIVIDAFGDVFWGDINATNSVRQFLNKYVTIIRKYRCSVLFVHHVCKGKNKQKSEKDQLLGSTGIEGKMRNVLMLSIVNDQHQLSIAKGNYLNRKDKKVPLYLNFDPTTLTFSKADGPAKPSESDEAVIASSGDSRVKGRPGRQRDKDLYSKAITLFNSGMKQCNIANELGVSTGTISRWVNHNKQLHIYDTSKVDDISMMPKF